jgi:nitroreductase
MELRELLARRRMTRSFLDAPVDLDLLDQLCAEALRAPTAGNSAGVRMTTVAKTHVAQYLERATDPHWRSSSPRFEGLRRAGAVVLVTSRPEDYFSRYGEVDKIGSGLSRPEAWGVPYWHTDAAMATMALLLLLEERGLGATIWGNFRHDARVLAWAGLRDEALFASVLVGVPDGNDRASTSLSRPVPPRAARVRRLMSATSPEGGSHDLTDVTRRELKTTRE